MLHVRKAFAFNWIITGLIVGLVVIGLFLGILNNVFTEMARADANQQFSEIYAHVNTLCAASTGEETYYKAEIPDNVEAIYVTDDVKAYPEDIEGKVKVHETAVGGYLCMKLVEENPKCKALKCQSEVSYLGQKKTVMSLADKIVKRSSYTTYPVDFVKNDCGVTVLHEDSVSVIFVSSCFTDPGCRNGLTDGHIVEGECCGSGSCYKCDDGYNWDGVACVFGDDSSATEKFMNFGICHLGSHSQFTAEDVSTLAKFSAFNIRRWHYDDVSTEGRNLFEEIKHRNPDAKIFIYSTGSVSRLDDDPRSPLLRSSIGRINQQDFPPQGTLSNNPQNAFNKDFHIYGASGDPVTNAVWDSYFFKFGDPDYVDFWAQAQNKDMTIAGAGEWWKGADGIHTDGTKGQICHSGCIPNPTTPGYNTAEDWQNNMVKFYQMATQELNQYGIKLQAGPGEADSEFNRHVWKALNDGPVDQRPEQIMEEHAFATYVGGAANDVQLYSYERWKDRIETYSYCKNIEVVLVNTAKLGWDAPGTDIFGNTITHDQLLYFTLGSFALIKRDSGQGKPTYFYLASNVREGLWSQLRWFDEYDSANEGNLNLGAAQTSYYTKTVGGLPLYLREFANGYVIVNPHNADVSSSISLNDDLGISESCKIISHSNLFGSLESTPSITTLPDFPRHTGMFLRRASAAPTGVVVSEGDVTGNKFTNTFLWRVGADWTAQDVIDVHKFDIIAAQGFRWADVEGDTWGELKKLNPNIKIFSYYQSRIKDNEDGKTNPYKATMGRWDISRDHSLGNCNIDNPDMFLYNIHGDRVNGANIHNFIPDWSNPKFSKYWIEAWNTDNLGKVWQSDGVFIDEVQLLVSNSGATTNPRNIDWTPALINWIDKVAKAMTEHNTLVWLNSGTVKTQESIDAYIELDNNLENLVHFAASEGAYVVGWGSGDCQFFAEHIWLKQIEVSSQIHRINYGMQSFVKSTLVNGEGVDNWGEPVTLNDALWYGLCSYHLGKNTVDDNTYFSFNARAYSYATYHDEYDHIDLGNAIGKYKIITISGNNIYYREFEKGYVYVNPTINDVSNIALPETCKQLTYDNFKDNPATISDTNTIDLVSHRGTFLLKSNG